MRTAFFRAACDSAFLAVQFLFILLFCLPQKKRPRFGLRLALSAFVWAAAAAACAAAGIQGLVRTAALPFRTASFAFLTAYSIAFQLFLTDEEPTKAIYAGLWGVTAGQFVLSVWYLAAGTFLPQNLPWLWLAGPAAVLALLPPAGRFLSAIWNREMKYHIGPRQTSSAILVYCLFEFLTLRFQSLTESWDLGDALLILLTELCLLIFLYMQHNMFSYSASEHELSILKLLKEQEREQYELTKENIDLINRKCHDLKHQVRLLREHPDSQSQEKYLQELSDSIRIYESAVKTGNDVLDTILTEKSLRCSAENIRIDCVADGAKLFFMDPADIYSVFGNALDNAIEEVRNFTDADRRQIDVLVHAKDNLLNIEIVNPIESALTFSDGLPKTTKGENGYHGYGLKSIRQIVQSYGGWMKADVQHGCFSLKILLPLQ